MNGDARDALVQLDEVGRQTLLLRAANVCVVYPDHRLPKGCSPTSGRLGVEGAADGSGVELLVDRSVTYSGPDPEVRAWTRAGARAFADVDELVDWLARRLARPRKRAPELTDMEAVARRQAATRRPIVVEAPALAALLETRVRGQESAVRTMAARVSRHLGKPQPPRPLSLLVLGPTGVGKTLACEWLADCLTELYGGDWTSLRLDMAEFQERVATSRLTGASPGYVGYGDSSQLIEVLRRSERAVVLFDEVEKAHPDVIATLLGLLDAGRLTPAEGRAATVDGRDALLLFTSNLCQDTIVEEIETLDLWDDPIAIDDVCRGHLLEAGMRPELLGRIGTFLVFRPLTSEAMAEVAVQVVVDIGRDYGLEVGWVEPDLVSTLLEAQPSGRFGARPIARVAEDLLGDAFIDASRQLPGGEVRCEMDDEGRAVIRSEATSHATVDEADDVDPDEPTDEGG